MEYPLRRNTACLLDPRSAACERASGKGRPLLRPTLGRGSGYRATVDADLGLSPCRAPTRVIAGAFHPQTTHTLAARALILRSTLPTPASPPLAPAPGPLPHSRALVPPSQARVRFATRRAAVLKSGFKADASKAPITSSLNPRTTSHLLLPKLLLHEGVRAYPLSARGWVSDSDLDGQEAAHAPLSGGDSADRTSLVLLLSSSLLCALWLHSLLELSASAPVC